MEYLYFADYRNKLDDDDILIIHCASNPEFMMDAKYSAELDGVQTEVKMVERKTIRSKHCYTVINEFFITEYQFLITVNKDFKKAVLKIKLPRVESNSDYSIEIDGNRFRNFAANVQGTVDYVEKNENDATIVGWTAGNEKVDIKVLSHGREIPSNIIRTFRKDIADYYLNGELNYPGGFEITVDNSKYKKVDVCFKADGKTTIKPVSLNKINSKSHHLSQVIGRANNYRKRYGFKIMIQKVMNKMVGTKVYDYDFYIKRIDPSKEELENQRNTKFEKNPLFSIIVPVYRPDKKFFLEMIQSVLDQTYGNFELCLADGSGNGFEMDITCDKILKSDSRIKYKKIEKNLGISGNTNEALAMATGDYIVLGDHDDLFRPNALFECVKLINSKDNVDVIYTDEDKYDCSRKKRIDAYFKPDFNLYLLRSGNYVCHMLVFSKAIREKIVGFRSEYDGAQDFDLTLRMAEETENIYHIPKVLYSWRCHSKSTALNPESKMYAYTAGEKAVSDHYKRVGIDATVKLDSKHLGQYHSTYKLSGRPLVSIIIPNMNHIDDLDKCIKSIEKQDYDNYEIIVVENNSNTDTFAYYDKAVKANPKIKIAKYECTGFNFSKINNYGIKQSSGELLLLLNNDTEMIENDCLTSLVSYALLPNVGMVGAKLLYGDNTIQHAGVIVGIGGIAGHAFVNEPADFASYMSYPNISREYSAVTAACAMISRKLFDEVGGFEEQLAVAFNDIDLCLKVRDKGKLIIYDSSAVLHHYESKSRGYEDTADKIQRFQDECDFFAEKWHDILKNGDPYYNPNLTLQKNDFSLREI